jgi:hypothetical protein
MLVQLRSHAQRDADTREFPMITVKKTEYMVWGRIKNDDKIKVVPKFVNGIAKLYHQSYEEAESWAQQVIDDSLLNDLGWIELAIIKRVTTESELWRQEVKTTKQGELL